MFSSLFLKVVSTQYITISSQNPTCDKEFDIQNYQYITTPIHTSRIPTSISTPHMTGCIRKGQSFEYYLLNTTSNRLQKFRDCTTQQCTSNCKLAGSVDYDSSPQSECDDMYFTKSETPVQLFQTSLVYSVYPAADISCSATPLYSRIIHIFECEKMNQTYVHSVLKDGILRQLVCKDPDCRDCKRSDSQPWTVSKCRLETNPESPGNYFEASIMSSTTESNPNNTTDSKTSNRASDARIGAWPIFAYTLSGVFVIASIYMRICD